MRGMTRKSVPIQVSSASWIAGAAVGNPSSASRFCVAAWRARSYSGKSPPPDGASRRTRGSIRTSPVWSVVASSNSRLSLEKPDDGLTPNGDTSIPPDSPRRWRNHCTRPACTTSRSRVASLRPTIVVLRGAPAHGSQERRLLGQAELGESANGHGLDVAEAPTAADGILDVDEQVAELVDLAGELGLVHALQVLAVDHELAGPLAEHAPVPSEVAAGPQVEAGVADRLHLQRPSGAVGVDQRDRAADETTVVVAEAEVLVGGDEPVGALRGLLLGLRPLLDPPVTDLALVEGEQRVPAPVVAFEKHREPGDQRLLGPAGPGQAGDGQADARAQAPGVVADGDPLGGVDLDALAFHLDPTLGHPDLVVALGEVRDAEPVGAAVGPGLLQRRREEAPPREVERDRRVLGRL